MGLLPLALSTVRLRGTSYPCREGSAADEPAAGSNAVRYVAELLRPDLGVLGEEVFLDELGVNLGNAVDLVGSDNAEVAHADLLDLAFLDEGELGLDGIVARPLSVNGVPF